MTHLIDITKGNEKSWFLGVCLVLALIASVMIATPAKPTSTIIETPKVIDIKVIQKTKEALKITPHDERQLQCLARNAYFEAGNQSEKGMLAVTNVVINRTEDSRFPDTPCKVVKQRRNGVCQFSWVCEGKKRIRDMDSYRRARAAAERVYLNKIHDVTHGALFYHANYVNPNWGLKRVATIGAHIFYKG
jgi:spore germination cell wall hydrolase CwlJ-like protein